MAGLVKSGLKTAGDILSGYGRFVDFLARTAFHTLTSVPRARVLFPQAYEIGVRSLPVVLATGLFIGMVLAVQMFAQLNRLSVESTSGPIINLSMIRDIGPVLAAVILAGRVGGAMAAELGTMRVTEQIDAIRVMGVNPIRYLVVPRLLSCVLLIPILTIYSGFAGVLGGYLLSVKVLGVPEADYWMQSAQYMQVFDILHGLLKSVVFGGVIGLISCYKGFQVRGGAEEVGRATTSAFVHSFVSILVANFFLAVFLGAVEKKFFP